MAYADIVDEFRGIVDTVIDTHAAELEAQGRTWPGYRHAALAGGLEFVSAEPQNGRNIHFGPRSEHLWGVAGSEHFHPVVQAYGRVAVVSILEDPEQLYKVFSFPSALSGLPAQARYTIDSATEARQAVAWTRSPHLERAAYATLRALTDEQAQPLIAQAAQLNDKAHKLTTELINMTRAPISSSS